MMDSLEAYRAVMRQVRGGSDRSAAEAMAELGVTFGQMDQRLRAFGDSVVCELITNRRFALAGEAYRQGFRHVADGSGNELHLLAGRLGEAGATELGYALLAAGAELAAVDRRGMTALHALTHAALIPRNRSEDTRRFLAECIRRAPEQALHGKNRAVVSAWDALHAGGEADVIALAERRTHGQEGSAVL